MKRPTPDKTTVSITEKAIDADQIVQVLKKDPARLSGFVQQRIKRDARLLKAKNNRRRAIEKYLNESSRQGAQEKRSIAFEIATRLMQQDRTLRLPRKVNELAGRVLTQWPKRGPDKPARRTIRRWLTEWQTEK